MDCKVRANPKPTIVWYREGKEVTESGKIKISFEKVEEDVYYIKLELRDPGIEDSGLYKCNIKNDLGELNANLTLNIEIIPVIKEKPKVIKIVKKRTVVVECKVLSKFAPDCTWFKEDTAVKEDSRRKVHVEQVKDVRLASAILNQHAQFLFVDRENLPSNWKFPRSARTTRVCTSWWPKTRKVKLHHKPLRSLSYPQKKNPKERSQN